MTFTRHDAKKVAEEPPVSALARRADPDTSHDAVPRQEKRAAQKRAILFLFHELGPMTDHELAHEYESRQRAMQWPATQRDSIRKRRSDLKNEGLVRDTGHRRHFPGHPASIIWAAVE